MFTLLFYWIIFTLSLLVTDG